VAFIILRLNGKPGAVMLPTGTGQQIAALNRALGFDGSILSQYGYFLKNLVLHFSVGNSLQEVGQSAISVVFSRLPATLELAVTAFLVGVVLGFLLSVCLQLSGSQWLRNTFIWLGVARQATPTFLFGVILVLVFAVKLGWLPSIGRGGITHLLLPAITLATFEVTLYMRLLDSSMAEQRQSDYVRTAYAKGQRPTVVLLRHGLPNALLPTLTVAGVNFGALLGGTVIVENVFGWPGIGELVINSVNARDYPVVQATLLIVSILFVVVNIGVDLLYAALDPRVRLA
jgi:peptide/nickel transport system permease protein